MGDESRSLLAITRSRLICRRHGGRRPTRETMVHQELRESPNSFEMADSPQDNAP